MPKEEISLEEFSDQQEQDQHAIDLERARRSADDYKRQRDTAIKRLDKLEKKCDLLSALDGIKSTNPAWKSRAKGRGVHEGIANLLLSDLHLDEIITPAQMGGINAYNRDIALLRLQNVAHNFVEVGRDFVNGIEYAGATILLAGDNFSGTIHEEFRETNESPIMASFDFWIDPMVAALKIAADYYEKVHVAGVVGNHGRRTHKPIYKNRVEDNFDWLFYRVLHRELKDDKRFTWDLPVSFDTTVTEYDTTFLLTHGDQFRGGSGIAGIMTPLAMGDFKKAKKQAAIKKPYDVLVAGHFHQLMFLPRIIINGSLKGYDEYASGNNFGFERPQQAFWVTTPEHGVTFNAPILCQDRKAEGW